MAAMSAPVKAMTGVGGGTVVVTAVTMIVFDTLDEQPEDVLHGPVVIVAVLVMVPVAPALTTALNVAVAVSPAARFVTVIVIVEPEALAVQLPLEPVEHAGAGLVASVSCEGTGSVMVAEPAPSPTFLTATV
jgi:hypothetical protein